MSDKLDKEFVEGIKQGSLETVIRALDAGANLECADQYGYPGLALRTASFLGKKEIVLELLRRGANADAANSDGPGAPLRMATRGKRDEVIAILQQNTKVIPQDALPTLTLPPSLSAAAPPSPSDDIESLVITACYGVDTQVLEGDLFRLSQSDIGGEGNAADERKAADDSKPAKRKFW